MIFALLLFSLGLHYLIYLKSKNEHKIFQGLLLFSNLYFCGGAYYFWIVVQETHFAGLTWGVPEIENSILLLTLSTTIVAAVVFLLTINVRTFQPITLRDNLSDAPPITRVLLIIGFAGSLIVIVESIWGGFNDKSPIFLIAYQFSDLLIPTIIYLVALRGVTKKNIALICYFVLYSTFVGFRYKIALLMIPLIALLLFSNIKKPKKLLYVGSLGSSVLVLFTLLTLFRSKFSGIDLTRSLDDGWNDLMYGFFAEANIIFGLASIVASNIEKDRFAYLQPILDIFRELVPRFIDTNKNIGAYIKPMQIGFITLEGENSGTAYPFIGEFGIMFGWWGIVIGTLVYASFFVFLRHKLRRAALTKEFWIAGLGLITAVMAYFNYSRGFLPAVAKSYIFIVFAYLLICSQHKKITLKAALRNKFTIA